MVKAIYRLDGTFFQEDGEKLFVNDKFPFSDKTDWNVNSDMVRYLVHTKTDYDKLPTVTRRNLQALGIELAQCREENMGLTRITLAKKIGLSSGFLAILEQGKVLPIDLTIKVWKCIHKVKGFVLPFP